MTRHSTYKKILSVLVLLPLLGALFFVPFSASAQVNNLDLGGSNSFGQNATFGDNLGNLNTQTNFNTNGTNNTFNSNQSLQQSSQNSLNQSGFGGANGNQPFGGGPTGGSTGSPPPSSSNPGTQAAPTTPITQSTQSVACNSLGGFMGNVFFCTFDVLGYGIFSLVNSILGVVGWLFNIVVKDLVFEFGSYLGASQGLVAGWTVIRDVCNIALLFGFIFMGIATILDIHGYEVKKTLPRLIIFAILLNFSLLASEAVIDLSNLFAASLYGATGTCSGQNGVASTQTSCDLNNGISGMLLSGSGLSTAFQGTSSTASPGFIFYMMLSIFAIILMVVLLAGAILLIVRAIALAFLMALSPIGFAGLAVPPLEKYAKMWWGKLLSQSFFAPIFLLFIFVGLKIGNGLGAGGSLAGFVASGSSNVSLTSELLVFALMIGFVVGGLIAAKQLGAAGSGFAMKMAGSAVGGATFGAAGFVGRRTVGRVSNYAAHAIRGSSIGRTTYGRLAAKVADKGAGSSYDFRATRAGKAASEGSPIGLGEAGGKGGYHAAYDAGKKKHDEYAKSITLSHDEEHELDDLRQQSWQAQRAIIQAKATRQPPNVIADLEDQKKDIDARAGALAARVQDYQARYATSLENSIFNRLRNPGTGFTRTAGTEMRKGAAKDIRNRLSESPQDRLLKQLNQALTPTAPAAAPAPAPAAGGHAAPPPAAGGGGGGGAHH